MRLKGCDETLTHAIIKACGKLPAVKFRISDNPSVNTWDIELLAHKIHLEVSYTKYHLVIKDGYSIEVLDFDGEHVVEILV